MAIIRWGILGAAKFAREHMGPAIHAARGAELSALATSNPEKSKDFLEFAPGLQVFGSYESMLASDAVDAVYVPLPNDMHVPWAVKALEAGKHVLVEKPVGMTTGEVDQLIAARDASGLIAAEAFMITHHPQWTKMRSLLDEKALGDLRRVTGVFSYDNSDDPGNIRNLATRGGGGLRDVGVYPIGALRWATRAEPERLLHAEITRENGVDTHVEMMLDMGAFTFSAAASMRAMRWQEMVFHGTHGTARMTAPFNPGVAGEARIEVHTPDHGMQVHRWPVGNQYVMQVEAFGQAIEGAEFACPLEFSRGTQVLIDEILE